MSVKDCVSSNIIVCHAVEELQQEIEQLQMKIMQLEARHLQKAFTALERS